MASGDDLQKTFAKFASKGEHREATTKDMTKWMKDAGCFGNNCSSNNLDIAFFKCKPKGKSTITCKELTPVIKELAKAYGKDHCLGEDDAMVELMDHLACAEPKLHGATKATRKGGVDRLTDTSHYTGCHRERFDKDGRGRGIEGREDRPQNTGYVGNYKGEGTYDKK